MEKLIAWYKNRNAAPAETSEELRRWLFWGMAVSMLGVGLTAGITMWPFAAVALAGLWFGHRYASQHSEDPNPKVKRRVFFLLHVAFFYMLVGIGVGLPYPQAQMAMFGMALISWEMLSRNNMYTGWLFVLANLHVTATLSRGFLFFAPLLIVAGCFLIFMWTVERLDALADGYKPVPSPRPAPADTNGAGGPAAWRWAIRFGGMAFAIAVVVFFLIPRFAGAPIVPPFTLRIPMQGGPQGQIINPAVPLVQVEGVSQGTSEYYHGFDSRLDLSYRGGLSTATMMYVRSPASSYWRSHAYDFYDGRTWVQSGGDEVEIINRQPGTVSFELTQDPPAGQDFVQTFFIANNLPNIAFTGGTPVELFIPAEQIAIDSTGGIRLAETLDKGLTYSVRSIIPTYEPDLLRLTGTDYPLEIRAKYFQLPDTVTQRTVDLAAELVAPHDSAYDRVKAIEAHLLVSYPYDYFPPPQKPNTDSVDQFLFIDQTGYCEHYVSSMVVMLRSQGIPARLVSGFGSGRYDIINNLYQVRALDAHSWVEVYFPGYGWVPFEPTPGWDGTPHITEFNQSLFSSVAGALNLPTIPFGTVASAVATALSVVMAPLMAIAVLVGLGFALRWLWRRVQAGRANRPPAYSTLAGADGQNRSKILRTYRRQQRRHNAPRQPEQTAQNHAGVYTRFEQLANLVDIAAYRPEPPTAAEVEQAQDI